MANDQTGTGDKPAYPHCENQHPTRPGVHCGRRLENGQHPSPHQSGDIEWPGTKPND